MIPEDIQSSRFSMLVASACLWIRHSPRGKVAGGSSNDLGSTTKGYVAVSTLNSAPVDQN